MLFIGYFEGLDSQRGIAWRCADSLAWRGFLGSALTEATPVQASMTIIRQRLPESLFDQVFVCVLSLLERKGLLRGKAVAIDATTLEANAAMDKGYHDNRLLTQMVGRGVRTHIPERRQKHRRWPDKPAAYEHAFRANRRRVRGNKGRQLNRWRSERCERTFAHVCETGGGRRAWVRGQTNVSQVHTLKCAAYNLGLLLRKVWGYCKPRNAKAAGAALFFALLGLLILVALVAGQITHPFWGWWLAISGLLLVSSAANCTARFVQACRKKCHSLTGC
jgi:hypothetical protein